LETIAFKYAKSAGVCAENSYPYTAKAGTCSSCSPIIPKGAVTGYTSVSISKAALMSAINKQPVSIGVAASNDWYNYDTGVYTGSCARSINHAVLGVGYGTDGGLDYWKIKNSWGASWGEKGYVRLQYNNCGCLDENVYVNVDANAVQASMLV